MIGRYPIFVSISKFWSAICIEPCNQTYTQLESYVLMKKDNYLGEKPTIE